MSSLSPPTPQFIYREESTFSIIFSHETPTSFTAVKSEEDDNITIARIGQKEEPPRQSSGEKKEEEEGGEGEEKGGVGRKRIVCVEFPNPDKSCRIDGEVWLRWTSQRNLFYIRLSKSGRQEYSIEAEEFDEEIIFDYDRDDRIRGFAVLFASDYLSTAFLSDFTDHKWIKFPLDDSYVKRHERLKSDFRLKKEKKKKKKKKKQDKDPSSSTSDGKDTSTEAAKKTRRQKRQVALPDLPVIISHRDHERLVNLKKMILDNGDEKRGDEVALINEDAAKLLSKMEIYRHRVVQDLDWVLFAPFLFENDPNKHSVVGIVKAESRTNQEKVQKQEEEGGEGEGEKANINDNTSSQIAEGKQNSLHNAEITEEQEEIPVKLSKNDIKLIVRTDKKSTNDTSDGVTIKVKRWGKGAEGTSWAIIEKALSAPLSLSIPLSKLTDEQRKKESERDEEVKEGDLCRDRSCLEDYAGIHILKGNLPLVSPEWFKQLSLSNDISGARKILHEVDDDPSQLYDFLRSRKSQCNNLGGLFTLLILFLLQKCKDISTVNIKYQLYEEKGGEKRTLGDLDYLFYNEKSSEWFHWEAGIKYYLLNDRRKEEEGISAFLGPNCTGDSMGKYVNR